MPAPLTNLITALVAIKYGNTADQRGRNNSIHPRVVNGVTKHKKVNTCGMPDPAKKENLILALMEHTERHPRDMQSVTRLARLQA